MTSNKILEVKNLKKYFRTPGGLLHAVDDVSFTIEEGNTLGVVGESGCGKTTLGRVVLNLIEATDGEVLFNGESVLNATTERFIELRKEMQIIFQDPYSSLDPRMSVADIISEPFEINRTFNDNAARTQEVYELMNTVGLDKRFAHSFPHQLDGGRRQRIGIARALALNPRFIVCDEPVSALDVSIQAQILNLMQDLQEKKGLTYLFITHNLSVVKHISTEIMVMYLGKTVEHCSSRELFINPRHPYTRELLAAIPQPITGNKKKRVLLRGELSSPVNPKPGCRFALRCNYASEICHEITPSLEAIDTNHLVACHNLSKVPTTNPVN